MIRPAWRILPLLLVSFLLFLAIGTAQAAQHHDVIRQEPLKDNDAPSDFKSWDGKPSGQDGLKKDVLSESVKNALSLLDKVKPPTASKLAQITRRPKGLVGSSLYYANQAFVFLFMNAPKEQPFLTSSNSENAPKLAEPLSKAIKLLEEAANEGSPDAIYILAEMSFYGNHTYPINYDEAFFRYQQLADMTGNATAQYMLGFLYATGLSPSVPTDQAKSMLYHTFAAEQGHTRSEMTLAYRNYAGIATPQNCDEAVHWYKKVADKAIRHYRSGPPGGYSLPRDIYRLADEDGGVYGEGASVSSSGPRAKLGGPSSDAYADIEDVLEYLLLQSSKGETSATFTLARLYYDGTQVKRDFKLAKHYFMTVAREYFLENGKLRKDVTSRTEKDATKAAGYLGRMFLRGEGMEQSYSRAKVWFHRGVKNGDALSQYSLGLMYLNGLDVERNVVKAAEYFGAAADQDLAVAQTNLGILFLDQGDTKTASNYFQLASRHSHIEAFYYLAEMENNGIEGERSCIQAAADYKVVAEKAEAIWGSLEEANEAYYDGNMDKAILGYLMAAEQGSEPAQANVAWLLDQTKPHWSPVTWLSNISTKAKTIGRDATLSLMYWTRSAKQDNVDSLVKMGDYYLSGMGTPMSAENAAVCYQAATEVLPDNMQSAQAMWNLGWMHENGVGIEQDFHLAKRFYDLALETNKEAYLPVKLSLFKLQWRSWWNDVTRGGVKGISHDEKERKRRTFYEWLNDFLEADEAMHRNEHYEDDDWSAEHDHIPGGDYWDGDDYDDGLLETLIIVGLVASLGWLIYYRQQQQQAAERRRREGVEGQVVDAAGQPAGPLPGQQPDGGFFPQPGDPAFQAWAAGGVGH
ncbi:Hypothetical protein R9X50_00633000 [Acrodontium crateriforme]|uniref:HCP-like protein n=1 Tax=Acrodontium crateriforme TaxID=150365 RepID=A0AAQ3RC38_9PEZI|nr:Hypothetical protein R9X50_00633000 [Acrodontium crateriforme]